MSEHLFPHGRRRSRRDLLDTAVLHHLLTSGTRPIETEHLAGALAGRRPTAGEAHAVRGSLARLARDGLVDRTATKAEASRPARRFHHLMLRR